LYILYLWKNYVAHSPVKHHSSVYNCFCIRTQGWLTGHFYEPLALFFSSSLYKYTDRRSRPLSTGIPVRMGHQVTVSVQRKKRCLMSHHFRSLFMIQNPDIRDAEYGHSVRKVN